MEETSLFCHEILVTHHKAESFMILSVSKNYTAYTTKKMPAMSIQQSFHSHFIILCEGQRKIVKIQKRRLSNETQVCRIDHLIILWTLNWTDFYLHW